MSSRGWLWSLGILVILVIAFVIVVWKSTNYSTPSNIGVTNNPTSVTPKIVPGGLGILTSFYRAEQIQGTYLETEPGSIVEKIPAYLTDPSLDYPYRFGVSGSSGMEVPYVTNLSIVRALGGWTSKFAPANSTNPDASDPIRYNATTGQWTINYSQITNGIQDLLNAGYSPSDITITLDNIPWDLSTQKCDNGDTAPIEGIYGNRAPIANYPEWETFITGFANSLNTLTGGHASDFSFKLGTEFSTSKSFCGTITDYENYYASTVTALEKVIPNPRVSLYEINQPNADGNDDFSTLSVYQWLVNKGLPITAVSTESNYITNKDTEKTPASRVGAVLSYLQALHTTVPSTTQLPNNIWQFGMVSDATTGVVNDDSLDAGPRTASWNFQNIFGLATQEPFDTISHWDVLDQVPTGNSGTKYLLPTPLAWLYQILDNLNGTEMYSLTSTVSPVQKAMIPYVMGFASDTRLTILASDYSTSADNGTSQTMSITIPADLLPSSNAGYVVRYIPMAVQNTPAYMIKQALANGLIPGASLAAPFANNANLVGSVADMAVGSTGAGSPSINTLVGAALVGNDALAANISASIKAMFTLQSYSGTLTENANGTYTLDAGTFSPGEMAVFTIDAAQK